MNKAAGLDKLLIKAGSQAALASRFGIKPGAVSQWFANGFIPVERAVECESAFGIDRKELIDPRLVATICGDRC